MAGEYLDFGPHYPDNQPKPIKTGPGRDEYGDPVAPDWLVPQLTATSGVDPKLLEGTAPKEQLFTVSAYGRPFRWLWGEPRVAGQIFKHGLDLNTRYYVLGVVWGIGPYNSINTHQIFGEPPISIIEETHYLANVGDANYGVVDPTLQALDPTYTDTLVGTRFGQTVALSYSVYQVPIGRMNGNLDIIAQIQARKIYNPITDTTAYFETPALILGDYLSHPFLGNLVVNWDDTSAIIANTELVSGSARRTMSWVIDKSHTIGEMIKTLRVYAGCFVRIEGKTAYLIPDRPSTSIGDITQHVTSINWERFAGPEKPNVIEVEFENRVEDNDWRSDTVEVAHPDVDANLVERVTTRIVASGHHHYAEAHRLGLELLNGYTVADVLGSIETTDEGLEYEAGDVVSLDDPNSSGLAGDFRLLEKAPIELGRWHFTFEEYREDKYSDQAVPDAGLPDTSLPLVSDVPEPLNLVVIEKIDKNNSGVWQSSLCISWDADTTFYPYQQEFDLEVRNGTGILIYSMYNIHLKEASTGYLADGETFSVAVRAQAEKTEYHSDWVSISILTESTQDAPPDVTGLVVIETGGVVRPRWDEIVDAGTWQYVIKYGVVGVTWESAILLNVTDSIHDRFDDIPQGTWDIMVKARTSNGIESAQEARVKVIVTLDLNAFLVDQVVFSSPTLSNIVSIPRGRLDTGQWYATDLGNSFVGTFEDPLQDYEDALLAYYGAGVQELLTETYDVGYTLLADFAAELPYTLVDGDAVDVITTLEMSIDDVAWTVYPNLGIKGAYRYARLRLKINSVDVNLYLNLADWTLKVNAISRREDAGGVYRTHPETGVDTVYLVGEQYQKLKSAIITPIGIGPYQWAVDNIMLGESGKNMSFEDWAGSGGDELPVFWHSDDDADDQDHDLIKSTAQTHGSGTYSCEMSSATTWLQSEYFRVTSGATFRASVWLYASASSTSTFQLSVWGITDPYADPFLPYDGSEDWSSEIFDNVSVVSGWQEFAGEVAIPSNIKYIAIGVRKTAAASAHDWYVDDITVNINAFDVYIYDGANAREPVDYTWEAHLV